MDAQGNLPASDSPVEGDTAAVALKQIGMKEADVERACEIVLRSPCPNPRALEHEGIARLLRDAFEGVRPA